MAINPLVRANRAVASSTHPAVTDTILQPRHQGGNAADAAIAGCLVQAAVEPHLTSYAGTVTALYWDARTHTAHQLESTGTLVPGLPPFRPLPGGLSWLSPPDLPPCACIPGFIPGLQALHTRFATRPWAELCEPAISWAEDGHPVTSFEYGFYVDLLPFLTYFPSSRKLFSPNGFIRDVGSVFRNPALAETTRHLATEGPDYCITGAWAQRFVDEANRLGWPITIDHMRAIPPRWQEPLRWRHGPDEILQLAPPERTGVFSAMVLGILCQLGIPSASTPLDSAEGVYFLSHALRMADQELGYLNDPETFDVPLERWLSPDYHAMRAEVLARSRPRVDLSDHVRAIGGAPTLAAASQPTGSCELSIVDTEGNWLQLMNTLQSGGIPGITLDGVPMYGSHAQSSMRYFIGGWFGGGGRIRSPIGNTLVLRNGEPWLALGTPGNVFATVPQVLARILDGGVSPDAAIDAPRMLPLRDDYVLEAEARLEPEVLADLVRLGIRYKPLPGFDVHMGSFQASWRDPESGTLTTYADPRRPGKAAGL